jgi:ABC-type transport system involved in multi-copper enzyme maturation permease subunit
MSQLVIFSDLKQILRRTDSILLVTLTGAIILVDFNERNSTFFMTWFLMLLLYFFFVAVLIYSFIRSYRTKSPNALSLRFFPFIMGVILIPVFFVVSSYYKNNGFKSIVVEARHEGELNSINLTLFNDRTFQLLNAGPFGGKYVRGTYKYLQDTLYIDTNKLTKIFPTGKFVLRINNKKQKYFDPIPPALHLPLLINNDQLTKK